MIKKIIGYSYNDLTILPATISDVNSRSECNPFVQDNFLPIFTAPMASVVNCTNTDKFLENGIIPIIPRNISLEDRIHEINNQTWVALSLKEFENLFIENFEDRVGDFRTHYFVCVDIANGHMKSLYDKCAFAKNIAKSKGYGLTIMTGNIANPETYKWIIEFNSNEVNKTKVIDYIRVGIGGGSGCITTSNVSIHYPQASLVYECGQIKKYYIERNMENACPKIIADGGIRNYDHVIKALALGADYVMIGSVFAQCMESAGIKTNKEINQKVALKFPIERYRDFEIDEKGNWWAYYTDEFIEHASIPWKDSSPEQSEYVQSLSEKKFIGHIDVKFFGMASADGQKSISGEKTKTAEGITKYLPVKYTLKCWTTNMISYLRSAMSYTNHRNLKDFIGRPILIANSISEIQAVNK